MTAFFLTNRASSVQHLASGERRSPLEMWRLEQANHA